MIIKKTITVEQHGLRLDEALSVVATISKSEARRIIDRGGCALNASMVRVASRLVKDGDNVEAGIMEVGRFKELTLPPESILYEDDELIAVNKPAGINTQRTPYQLKGTLEYWVSEYFRMHEINEPARVVHRLDRGTSGVMLFPKQKRAAAWISSLFHDGMIEKRYLVLVSAIPTKEEWLVDGAIGKIGSAHYGIVAEGRSASTSFRVISSSNSFSLVEATPHTGRTHQIRVHLESCGLPIVGDNTYGGKTAGRMMLHCSSVLFKNPDGFEKHISAPVDNLFDQLLHHNF